MKFRNKKVQLFLQKTWVLDVLQRICQMENAQMFSMTHLGIEKTKIVNCVYFQSNSLREIFKCAQNTRSVWLHFVS